jgi:hypothetical protein
LYIPSIFPACGKNHEVPRFRWKSLETVTEPLVDTETVKFSQRIDRFVVVPVGRAVSDLIGKV